MNLAVKKDFEVAQFNAERKKLKLAFCLILKTKQHRINVTNNPVNFVDPFGYRKAQNIISNLNNDLTEIFGDLNTVGIISNTNIGGFHTMATSTPDRFTEINQFINTTDSAKKLEGGRYVISKAIEQLNPNSMMGSVYKGIYSFMDEAFLRMLAYGGAKNIKGYESYTPTRSAVSIFEFQDTIEIVGRAKFYNPDDIKDFGDLKSAVIKQFSESFKSENIALGNDPQREKNYTVNNFGYTYGSGPDSKTIRASLVDMGTVQSGTITADSDMQMKINSQQPINEPNSLAIVFRDYHKMEDAGGMWQNAYVPDTRTLPYSDIKKQQGGSDFRFAAMHETVHSLTGNLYGSNLEEYKNATNYPANSIMNNNNLSNYTSSLPNLNDPSASWVDQKNDPVFYQGHIQDIFGQYDSGSVRIF